MTTITQATFTINKGETTSNIVSPLGQSIIAITPVVSTRLTGLVRASNITTATCDTPHPFKVGDATTVFNVKTDDSLNGNIVIASVPTNTTFTFSNVGSNTAITNSGENSGMSVRGGILKGTGSKAFVNGEAVATTKYSITSHTRVSNEGIITSTSHGVSIGDKIYARGSTDVSFNSASTKGNEFFTVSAVVDADNFKYVNTGANATASGTMYFTKNYNDIDFLDLFIDEEMGTAYGTVYSQVQNENSEWKNALVLAYDSRTIKYPNAGISLYEKVRFRIGAVQNVDLHLLVKYI
jgi:hypothetical protein